MCFLQHHVLYKLKCKYLCEHYIINIIYITLGGHFVHNTQISQINNNKYYSNIEFNVEL